MLWWTTIHENEMLDLHAPHMLNWLCLIDLELAIIFFFCLFIRLRVFCRHFMLHFCLITYFCHEVKVKSTVTSRCYLAACVLVLHLTMTEYRTKMCRLFLVHQTLFTSFPTQLNMLPNTLSASINVYAYFYEMNSPENYKCKAKRENIICLS